MERYEHQKIEAKWREAWTAANVYKTTEDPKKEKFYILDMFPYPSGDGLHVGHPKGYIATDVISRYKKMNNFNVLHPMGWDAFGLPAEQYALKNKMHPKIATDHNIATFKKQLEKISLNYDWEREISTIDPSFYKWTQWTFIRMFKKGLVFQSNEPINWCPSCKTGLANEDLENGACERCGTPIEKKKIPQWVIKITDYADRLLADLDKLEWQDHIKELQRNWIGRSEGAKIQFKITCHPELVSGSQTNEQLYIDVFTTRPDTLFGATYMVLAPEHPLVDKFLSCHAELVSASQADAKEILKQVQDDKKNCYCAILNDGEVRQYQKQTLTKTEIERTTEGREKTGVKLEGVMAINPANGAEIPIYIADYVLADYGTGAIMAVPAHDERDWEFAKRYDIPIVQVVAELDETKGKYTVRDDKKSEERRSITVIIKHWAEDRYYCLDWRKSDNDWTSFVIGGVEDGETIEETAVREAREETGYQNMRVVRRVGQVIRSRFFAAHKDINMKDAVRECVYLELIDDAFIAPDEKHTKNHDGMWIEKEDVDEFLNLPAQKTYWRQFLTGEDVYTGSGVMMNSGEFDGMDSEEAKKAITEKVGGEMTVNYKLRDWVFSRQRYWGEPIPLIHCAKCGVVPVPEEELPLTLPEVDNYEPTGTGESPLAAISDWVNTVCPTCGGEAKRETNTMPQWAGSSWYHLRYIDPKNDTAIIDKDKDAYWSPVDFYVGGAEHATRHLIYARFWHKFLFDIGAVAYDEPYKKLQTVGLIMAEDGRKMSKRWGNVINPDEVIDRFGSDTFRMYEMFMGPFDATVAWSTESLIGPRKFLERLWKFFGNGFTGNSDPQIQKVLHKTIKKVGEDIDAMKYNTAIAQMMILMNTMEKHKTMTTGDMEKFLLILSPFCPHITQELWSQLGRDSFILQEQWPMYDAEKIIDDEITLAVQVNGKVRDQITVSADITEEDAKAQALASEKIQKYTAGKDPKKIIFVKGKLISIVV
ncbi:MAG: class I tRNA ligase family protein [Parcubacteria group bacterium]|jgi:leucyl-tRNA synthetase